MSKQGLLSGYRALDLSDSKGAYCTRLLADLGAEVIKIEKPSGDRARAVPPFAGDVPHQEKSLHFLYRNANKLGITLDWETPEGGAILKRLVEKADVLVETGAPGLMKSLGLDYPQLSKINPGLIMASITEFGQSGPYRDWKGSDIVDFAMSSTMIGAGFPDGSPVRLPGNPAYDATAMTAAISIVVSIFDRGTSGEGHYIDVSVHESARLGLYPWMLTIYSYGLNSKTPPREGRIGASLYPVYPCKDGYVRVVALTPRQWQAFKRILGNPEVLNLPEWQEYRYRTANAADLYALMADISTKYSMQELFEAGHREGVPIAPIYDVAGFSNSPQTKSRHFFRDMEHAVAGKFAFPGIPFKCTDSSDCVNRAAPLLGEHNEQVYVKELGYSVDELAALRRAGVI